jgi:hypothetical protein
MKNVIPIIVIFFACSCTKSSSNSNDKNNLITMETSSGKNFSTSNITRVLQTTSGVFYFNADPFSTYRKFYFFTGNFDVNNSLTGENAHIDPPVALQTDHPKLLFFLRV